MKLEDMGVDREEGKEAAIPYAGESEGRMYAETHVYGPLAEKMGVAEMKAGDVYTQTVQWRVKELTKTDRNGETSVSATLCMEKASAPEKSESEESSDSEGDDSSPMSYIESLARGDD